MTLKHLVLRYIKDKGLFSKISGYHRNYKTMTAEELFMLFSYTCRLYSVPFGYSDTRESFMRFLSDWAVNESMKELDGLRAGDLVGVKTIEGKYSYVFKFVGFSRANTIFVEGSFQEISVDRICSINGKEVNINDGWKFKRPIIPLIKK